MKRQPTEWGKKITNEATDKRLISKIYKHLMKLNIKKIKNKKMDGGPKQMAKRHMKRCSTSLIKREMKIKTTMRYHLTPISIAIKNST